MIKMRNGGLFLILLGYGTCKAPTPQDESSSNSRALALFEHGKDFAMSGDHPSALLFYEAGFSELDSSNPMVEKWVFGEVGRSQYELAIQSNDSDLAHLAIGSLDHSLSVPIDTWGSGSVFDNDSARLRKELFVGLLREEGLNGLEAGPRVNFVLQPCYSRQDESSCGLEEQEYFLGSTIQEHY